MPDLHMGDAVYHFQREVVDRVIPPGQPGNYALGEKNESGEFLPKLIGRSDTDLRVELMGKAGVLQYTFFKFTTSGPRNAYDLECAQFHTFGRQLDNKTHPAATPGSGNTCFLCGR
jgi:hypothetical protein